MNGLRMHHLHPLKKTGRTPPPPDAKRINSPASRITEIRDLKTKITHNFGWTNQQAIGKNWPRMHHLHLFFNNFLRGTPPPPYCERIKNFPFLALYDPLQLRWKLSRITYIEALKAKLLGKNQLELAKKWAQNAPFVSIFEIFLGEIPTPPPLLREDTPPPPLALYDLLQLR